jgi:chorismate--pyruvate lyase
MKAPSSWKTRMPATLARHSLRTWLETQGSLTARIKTRCSRFNLVVLYQGLAKPLPDEVAALGIKPTERAWVREVLLCEGSTPLVFAHSVLPLGHVRGAWNLFQGLGNRPLGEALFADRSISRQPLVFCRLKSHQPLRARLHRHAPTQSLSQYPDLPARRSLFERHGKSLMVTEVFLPNSVLVPASLIING